MNTTANILVIDDEDVVRRSLYRALDGQGRHVELADDGSHGLSALRRRPFDVVLLDLRMPGMDGVEVLDTIKRNWPETEVIVITGYPAVDTAKRAIQLGAYDYLAKPLGPDQVLNAANDAVRHKRWASHSTHAA